MLRGSRRGFTIMELMVVLAIVAVLSAMLFPMIRFGDEERRGLSMRNQVFGLLGEARAEAVRLGRPVVIDPRETGVVACLDNNNNFFLRHGSDSLNFDQANVCEEEDAVLGEIRLDRRLMISQGQGEVFAFDRRGMLRNDQNAYAKALLTFCSRKKEGVSECDPQGLKWRVEITPLGLARATEAP